MKYLPLILITSEETCKQIFKLLRKTNINKHVRITIIFDSIKALDLET